MGITSDTKSHLNFQEAALRLKKVAIKTPDDITRFEYMQKTNKETAPALVGIELQSKHDYKELINKMKHFNIDYTELNKDDTLFGYLV